MVTLRNDLRLRANLIEISHAEDIERDLVASPDKKRIYHKSFGWGRFLKFFEPAKQHSKRLDAALEGTRRALADRVDQLKRDQAVYFEQMPRKFRGKPYHFQELERAEESIASFCLYFKPLIKDVIKGRLRHPLSEICPANSRLQPLFERLRFSQRIKDFEEVTGGEIPFHELLNLSLDKELKVKEEKKVQEWLEKVTRATHKRVASFNGSIENSYVKVRFFHRFLDEIVNFFNAIVLADVEATADVTVMEAKLMQLGCRIFEAPDFKHIAWRNTLAAGQSVTIHGKEYILGEILENRERNLGKPLVFAVEGDSTVQIEIYHNEAWNFIQLFDESILHCGIIRPKLIAIEKHGAFFLRERLYGSLSDVEWKTTGTKVGVTDTPAAEPFLQLLKGLIGMPLTPYPMSRDSFRCNHEGELRAAKLLIPGPKSFEAIERFAFECSFGNAEQCNSAVFRYFMHESGLADTQEAKNYQELVIQALEGKDHEKSISRNKSITDPTILKSRERFHSEIREIKEACLAELQLRYEVTIDRKFEKEINLAIQQAHLKYCPGSILVPDFYQKALTSVLNKIEPKLKQEYLHPLKDRIQREMFQGKVWKEGDLYRQIGIFNLEQMNLIYKEGKKKLALRKL